MDLAQWTDRIRAAETRDGLLLTLAQALGQHLDDVTLYQLKNETLVGWMRLDGDGVDRSVRNHAVPVTVAAELWSATVHGVPFFGAPAEPQAWTALGAGGGSFAVIPIKMRGRVVSVATGRFQDAPPSDEQWKLVQLVDLAAMSLHRLIIAARLQTSHGQGAQYASPKAAPAPVPRPPAMLAPALEAPAPEPPIEAESDGLLAPDLNLSFIELIMSGKVKVPPYPAVATELTEVVNRGDFGLRELADIIRMDQALTAEVLRYANSAALRGVADITSVDHAVNRIGARSLVGLALSVKLANEATADGPLLEMKHRIWREAVTSSVVCQQLAPRFGLEPGEAFVCGLLHDFGKVVAVACIEKLIDSGQKAASDEAWMDVIERYHVELGRLVSERWNLPESVVVAIHTHHRPELAGPHRRMVDLVTMSDQVVLLLHLKSCVTVEDLETLPLMDDRGAVDALVNLIPKLPSIVSPMSNPEKGDGDAKPTSVVIPSDSMLSDELVAAELEVWQRRKAADIEYKTRYIATDGLGMVGRDSLEANSLVSVDVVGEGSSIQIWLRIVRCVSEGRDYLIEGKTYALGGAAAQKWYRLVDHARQQAAGA
jgi:HD-like signal output (HDOD) protein